MTLGLVMFNMDPDVHLCMLGSSFAEEGTMFSVKNRSLNGVLLPADHRLGKSSPVCNRFY
jgi:hypothetical protein